MGSFSGLGIGLSCVFAFILMGLVAELCYLLWWKKRTVYSTNTKTENLDKFSFQLCWKNPNSVNGGSSRELKKSVRNQFEQEDLETGSSKLGYGEEGVESELMRMHNLCGPPRFLFTIKEESREDLESDDGKSRSSNCKGLNDHVFGGDPLKGSNLRNPVLESMTEAEMNKLRSSPPPTFKFLKDAEDKFVLMQEADRKRGLIVEESESAIKDGEFSFVKMNKPAAQVMPLASSPIFSDKKSIDLP